MQLSPERRSFLTGEHRQLGWTEIPSTAPLHIQNQILEYRHANIENVRKPVSKPAAPAVITETEREALQRKIRAAQISLLQ
jgi:hypothetical protein